MLKEPVRRPRVFFLCAQKDAAVSSDRDLLVGLLSATRAAMIPARGPAKIQDRILSTSAAPGDKHNIRCTEKQAKVLRDLRARVSDKTGSQCLTVDVSQSKTHVRFGLGGLCPTFARSSKIVIVDSVTNKARFLTALDGLLLHSYPVHQMHIPASFSDATLKQLVGNTQHVQAVAAAELLAMRMVNWSYSASGSPPEQPTGHSKSAFLTLAWKKGAWIPRPALSKSIRRCGAIKATRQISNTFASGPNSADRGSASLSSKRKLSDLFKPVR